MIKTFDSKNLNQLRNDLEAALATIRQNHGITISLGRITYDPGIGRATTKLTMNTVSDPNTNVNDPRAAVLAKAEADFKLYASSFGLTAEQYGATFTFGRETYKLSGLKPRSPKRPILGTSIRDGKTYVFPESAIVSLQSKEHKNLYGIKDAAASTTVTCSNENAFDFAKGKATGKCTRTATTSRKGYGRNSRSMPYCDECAQLIDESRREMEAEARCS